MPFILFIFLSFSLFAEKLQVDVHATSVVLMNGETGAILFEKEPVTSVFPASTTKIATALFVLSEKCRNFEQKLKVSAESLALRPLNKKEAYPPYWWYQDGTHMDLLEGELVSVDALLHGLMMVSANDAANVIAEGFGNTIEGFVDELNQYVKTIGCHNTHFLNPHGCHHPNHVTTAYDLCLMTKEALRIPKFREIVSTPSFMKPKTNKQKAGEIQLINALLKPGRFFYPKAIGVKSGFHLDSQYTLVASAEHEGRVLIAAIMGTANSADRYRDAIALFEAAFQEEKVTKRFFGPDNIFSRKISGAKGELKASLCSDLCISYFPAEEETYRAFVLWESPDFPIRKKEVVGEVQIVNEKGDVLAKGNLLAKEDLKQTLWSFLKGYLVK